jgi:GntR family transcriptional regulator/MocR family aminotransferase
VTHPLQLELDRSAKTPLAEQIRHGIGGAIDSGVLALCARLPFEIIDRFR